MARRLLSCLAALIATTSIVAPSHADEPFAGASPLATSPRLAPPPTNFFDGRLKPMPELVERERIKTEIFVPLHPIAFDDPEAPAKRYRDGKERTGSGVWKLPFFYAGLEPRQFDEWMQEETFVILSKKIDEWQAARPQSPTPVIIKGRLLIDYAESAVAPTTAGARTNGQVVLKQKRYADAYDYLMRNKAVGSSDPQWYGVTLRTMGPRCASSDDMMKIVEEGAGKFADYQQMYFDFIYATAQCIKDDNQLDRAIAKIADYAVEKSRATEKSSLYARSYWYARGFVPGGYLSTLPSYDWQKMKASMDDVIAQYPDAWNINHFALFACEANDQKKMRELLPRALETPAIQVWGSPEDFAACWSLAGLPEQVAGRL